MTKKAGRENRIKTTKRRNAVVPVLQGGYVKKEFLGEFWGTFILVLFGCGSVAVTVLFGAHQGLFQIAIVWGIGVTLAIYAGRHLSCAHFNPAVSIAMAVTGRMKPKKLLTYIPAQFLGAFAAGLAIYLFFSSSIAAFEAAQHITRGTFESVATAKMFGEYYNQPGGAYAVSPVLAACAEGFGTFLLVMTIFFLTETCNVGKPDDSMAPLFIGLTVTSVICLLAPLTQAGLNPARDFAPRLVALLFGWGKWAFPDQAGGAFFVYILGPVAGGVLAGVLFTKVVEPVMWQRSAGCNCSCEAQPADRSKRRDAV